MILSLSKAFGVAIIRPYDKMLVVYGIHLFSDVNYISISDLLVSVSDLVHYHMLGLVSVFVRVGSKRKHIRAVL